MLGCLRRYLVFCTRRVLGPVRDASVSIGHSSLTGVLGTAGITLDFHFGDLVSP